MEDSNIYANDFESSELSNSGSDFIQAISCIDDIDLFDTKFVDNKVSEIVTNYCQDNYNHINQSNIDTVQFNNIFVELVRYFKDIDFKNKYTCENLVCNIFINLAEYFELEYNDAFNLLNRKLQNVIKTQTIKIVGKRVYEHVENSVNKKMSDEERNTTLTASLKNHTDVSFNKLV